jgi:hypothetical protein
MNRVVCLAFVSVLSVACSSSANSSATPEIEPSSKAADVMRAGELARSAAAGEADDRETSAELARPAFREVTVPARTSFAARLATGVSSDTSRAEDPVRAKLAKPIVIDNVTVVPAGAELSGVVLEAHRSGRVKGRASVAFRFNQLHMNGGTHDISTSRIARLARATKKDDAIKIGIGTGAGTVVGALTGGKKGAAIGAAVGAGGGTGVVLATRGEEVRVGAGTTVTATLAEPLTILVPVS